MGDFESNRPPLVTTSSCRHSCVFASSETPTPPNCRSAERHGQPQAWRAGDDARRDAPRFVNEVHRCGGWQPCSGERGGFLVYWAVRAQRDEPPASFVLRADPRPHIPSPATAQFTASKVGKEEQAGCCACVVQ